LGHIVITDEVKPDSKDAIAALKKLGITKTVMLTGDRRAVAESIGKELGVDEIKSELMPADKVSAVYAAEPVADSLAVVFTIVIFAVNFKKAMCRLEEK